jgi:hypothetical protein
MAFQTNIEIIERDGYKVLETSVTDAAGNYNVKGIRLCLIKEWEDKKADIIQAATNNHKAQTDYAMQVMYISNQELKALSAS